MEKIFQNLHVRIFVAREIQCFELGIFSFNSYLYYLTGGFTASTCAFNLPTRAFSVLTGEFELVTRGFELVTRKFELVTREFELVTRGFELVTCEFELVTCGFEPVTRRFELVICIFELVTRVLLFHIRQTLLNNIKYNRLSLATSVGNCCNIPSRLFVLWRQRD